MQFKNTNIIIGLSSVAAIFGLSAATGVVREKTPMTITQCNNQAESEEQALLTRSGYNLSEQDRREFLHIGSLRRACIDDAKAGPRLALAGL